MRVITMLRKSLIAIGVLALCAGISCAGYWGLTPARSGSYKASANIRSGQECVFHEYLPEGVYLISLYGSGGHVWRSDSAGDYWGLAALIFGGEPSGRGVGARDVGPQGEDVRAYGSEGKLRLEDRPAARAVESPGDVASARDTQPEVQLERRYSGEGKLDAVRPRGFKPTPVPPKESQPGVGARHLDRNLELGSQDYRDYGRDGWYRDLPRRDRGGPDVDLYVFNRWGQLVAVSDSYESSESVMLRIDRSGGRWLEIAVHSARGSGSFYLSVVRF